MNYRTDPKRPRPGEWYYRSAYAGPRLVQHPYRWGTFQWNESGRYDPVDALRTFRTEAEAEAWADAHQYLATSRGGIVPRGIYERETP